MNGVRVNCRSVIAAVLVAASGWAMAACGSGSAERSESAQHSGSGQAPGHGSEGKTKGGVSVRSATWQEPASYTYTLESFQGLRALIGTFRVTVRDGKVAKAVGLDESGRRVVQENPEDVPTIGGLMKDVERAEKDGADKVKVEHAADGRPSRITVDWYENAVDDEALYAISDYQPVRR